LRLAVERKAAGETSEQRETDELEAALEQLGVSPKRFDELVQIQKTVSHADPRLENFDEHARE
jgi:hypothetical protein